jgi:hypothetical protein
MTFAARNLRDGPVGDAGVASEFRLRVPGFVCGDPTPQAKVASGDTAVNA